MKIFLAVFALLISSLAQALPATLNFQARIRIQDGQVLEHADVNFFFEYTSPDGSCVLYQEAYDHQNMYGSGGLVSFQLGVGVDNPTTGYRQIFTSAATLKDTFKNSGTYTCKDGSTYNPGLNDIRKLAVKFAYTGSGGWNEVAGIKINSVPFAMYATESQNTDNLGGFAAALYTKFADFTTCTGGQVLTYNGTTFSCVSPGSSTNFSGVLAGDVSGTQSATVVDTVGGKTAAQVSTSVDDTTNATNAATASRIVKRDGSGNAAFNTAQANNFSGRNLLLFEATDTNHVALHAPTTFTAGDYVLTLPQNAGTAGYVLSTNGSGVTSWISPTTGNVTSVGASAPLVSTGGQTPNISIPAATAAVDGYLSAADFTTFNSKVSSQWTNNLLDIYFNTGHVGIGTATPATPLDVVGQTQITSPNTQIILRDTDEVAGEYAYIERNSTALNLGTNDGTTSTIGMTIKEGQVGIGTTAPTAPLEIASSSAVRPRIILNNTSAGNNNNFFTMQGPNAAYTMYEYSDGGSLNFTSSLNAGEIIRLWGASGNVTMPTGNLGVGTNGPVYKVDVVGDVNVTGNFKINGVNIAAGTVTSVGATAPLLSSGGATPNISMPAAATAVDGYLTATDWNTFNNKQTAGAYITALTGDVTAAGPGSSVATIANLAVTDAKINDVAFGKITGKPTTLLGYGITDAVTTVTAGAPLLSSGGTTPNITMPAATASVDGYLSAADFTIFNNKTSSQWINNAADIYFNTGKVGIGTNIPYAPLHVVATNQAGGSNNDGNLYVQTSDAQGANIGGSIGFGGLDGGGSDRVFATAAGRKENGTGGNYAGYFAIETRPNGGSLAEGLRVTSIGRVGVGLTNPQYKLDVNGDVNIPAGSNFKINGVNIAAGTVTSVGATAPLLSSGGATPNISMPAAATAVDGYLTATDWNTFNNKLGTASVFAGDVTGTSGATVVEKIRGTNVAITGIATGNFLKYDGTNWVNSTPVIGDVTGLTTALSNKLDVTNMPASCNASSTLTFASPSGAWSCTPIAGLDAGVITTGTIDAARLPATANYWQPMGAGDITYTGGNVELANMKALRWGANTDGASIRFESASDIVGASKLIIETQDNSDEEIIFRQTGLDRLNIGINGYVGVNTPSPVYQFHVSAANSSVQTRLERTTTNPGVVDLGADDSAFRVFPGGYPSTGNTFTILPTGNVGIGVLNPSQRLDVSGSALFTTSPAGGIGIRAAAGNPTDAGDLMFLNNDNSVRARIHANNGASGQLRFAVDEVDRMTLLTNGHVGVGTTNPLAQLQIGQSTLAGAPGAPVESNRLSIATQTHTGGAFDFYERDEPSTANLDIRYGALDLLTFSSGSFGGKVGIGTRTPAAALDVVGQIRPSMGTPLVNPASNNVDFATGNTQYVTLSSCPGDATTVNLFSMLEGGSYSLIITSPANCLVDFTGISHPIGGSGGVTVTSFKYPAGQKFSSTGNPVVYSFLRANNFVFVAQVVDFQ